MRISDWSSDVCSSDLEDVDAPPVFDIVEAAAEAEQSDAVVIETLREMLSDPDCAFQPEAFLYQDFSVRCRMQKLKKVPLDLAAFRRRFALAKGGVFDPADPRWRHALSVADSSEERRGGKECVSPCRSRGS